MHTDHRRHVSGPARVAKDLHRADRGLTVHRAELDERLSGIGVILLQEDSAMINDQLRSQAGNYNQERAVTLPSVFILCSRRDVYIRPSRTTLKAYYFFQLRYQWAVFK